MGASQKEVKLTVQQQRVLKLLFKFRYVSAQLLGQVMGIRRAVKLDTKTYKVYTV